MSQDEYIRTALRVPPELHKALHEAADAHGRSFNAEIIARLQASFAPQRFQPSATAHEIPPAQFEAFIESAASRMYDFLLATVDETVAGNKAEKTRILKGLVAVAGKSRKKNSPTDR